MQLRLDRIRMAELEVLSLSNANEKNQKFLTEATDVVRGLLFPGSTKAGGEQERWEKDAKALLAKEIGKAFIVKPARHGSPATANLIAKGNPDFAKQVREDLKRQQPGRGRVRTYKDEDPAP